MKRYFSVYAFALRRKMKGFLIRFLVLALIGLGCYRMLAVRKGQYVKPEPRSLWEISESGEWEETGEEVTRNVESKYASFSGGYCKLILTMIIIAGYCLGMASCASNPSQQSRTEYLRGRLRISGGSAFGMEFAANITLLFLTWMFLILILSGAGQIYQSVNNSIQGTPYIFISLRRYFLFHAVAPMRDAGQWIVTGAFLVVSALMCSVMMLRKTVFRAVLIGAYVFSLLLLLRHGENVFVGVKDYLLKVGYWLIGPLLSFGITAMLFWLGMNRNGDNAGKAAGTEPSEPKSEPAKEAAASEAESVNPFCRYSILPPVQKPGREIALYVYILIGMVICSLCSWGDFMLEEKSLNEMLSSRFIGLTILAVVCVMKAIGYYMQFYRVSRSVYVMKRVKNRAELHLRCLAFPVLFLILGIIISTLLLIAYVEIYHNWEYSAWFNVDEPLDYWRMLL